MTTTPQRLPEQHQAAQARIAAEVAPLLNRAGALLDLTDLEHTLPRFTQTVTAIVDRLGAAAATTSNLFYKRQRKDLPGKAPVVDRSPASELEVTQMIVESVAARLDGRPDMADQILDSEAEQLVQDQARRQVMSTARLDREAKGWARTVEPGACSFCLMLAIRGPYYNTHASANFRAHKKKPNGSGGDCRCHAEPVFGEWEPQAAVRAAQELWDATNGKGKHSGHDARVAFRQAVEGRKVTGAKKGAAPNGKDRKGRAYEAVTRSKTREQQEHQLRVLEALPPAKTPEAAKWQAGRIAEIRKWLSENK